MFLLLLCSHRAFQKKTPLSLSSSVNWEGLLASLHDDPNGKCCLFTFFLDCSLTAAYSHQAEGSQRPCKYKPLCSVNATVVLYSLTSHPSWDFAPVHHLPKAAPISCGSDPWLLLPPATPSAFTWKICLFPGQVWLIWLTWSSGPFTGFWKGSLWMIYMVTWWVRTTATKNNGCKPTLQSSLGTEPQSHSWTTGSPSIGWKHEIIEKISQKENLGLWLN